MKLARQIAWGALVAAMFWSRAAVGQQELDVARQLTINREVGAVRELRLEAGQNRLLVLSETISRVAVADPMVADLKVVSPTQLLLTAKGVGSTDLTLWSQSQQPLVVALRVTLNLEGLREQLAQLFPKEAIQVTAAGDMVVLSGEVSDVRLPERIGEVAKLHVSKVANLVRVAGDQQVQLEVKFAEVSRNAIRELGMNLFHKAANGNHVGGMFGPRTPAGHFLNTRQNPSIPGAGTTLGPKGQFGGQPPDVAGQAFGSAFSLFFSTFSNGLPFSVMLNVLEENGLARLLAEPTLVALSGQEAEFLAGGELPIPMSSSLGQVNVEWKKFGIRLRFTPTVIGADTIHLALGAEVSDIDPSLSIVAGGISIPGLVSRQSETTVRLADGQSFAIAGLLSESTRSEVGKVPLLGSIPILGALFRSTAYERKETELIVVVTARLARPMQPQDVPPLPTDYEQAPNDFELFLLGWDSASAARRSKPGGRDAAVAAGKPAGAFGFAR